MKGYDLARYILDRCQRDDRPITVNMLQNVMYLTQRDYWFLTKNFIVDEDFVAVKMGAAMPEVENINGVGRCWRCVRCFYLTDEKILDEKIERQLSPIIDYYRKKTSGWLMEVVTRPGRAWEKNYQELKRVVIPKKTIKEW